VNFRHLNGGGSDSSCGGKNQHRFTWLHVSSPMESYPSGAIYDIHRRCDRQRNICRHDAHLFTTHERFFGVTTPPRCGHSEDAITQLQVAFRACLNDRPSHTHARREWGI
jgi:hypothetical protein